MRLALASLIALGAVSTAAIAQEQPAPAPAAAPAQTAPAQAAPADPAAAPAQTPAPADPGAPVDQAPVVPAPAAGAAPVDTYVEPVRPPPTTDPVSLQLLSVLDRICKPAVVGGDFDSLAKAAGLKLKKKMWTLDLGKPYSIVLDNPGSNKNVCTVTIQYAQGDVQAQALATALHDWATWENSPQLRLIRNDQVVSSDYRRFTVSWDDAWANGHAGLVYMRLKKTDGSPVGRDFEKAQILYSTTSR